MLLPLGPDLNAELYQNNPQQHENHPLTFRLSTTALFTQVHRASLSINITLTKDYLLTYQSTNL